MKDFFDLPNLVLFMRVNAFDTHPLFVASINALLAKQITAWEFICACQYITDAATINKLCGSSIKDLH